MVTLAEAVNATTRLVPVSGDVSGAVFGRQYRIDDEIITLRAFERDWDAIGKPVNDHRWLVSRGDEDSVAAAHDAAVEVVASVDAFVSSETLTPPTPFAEGGGGGGVTNSAPANAIAVSDGTNLTGSADLVWDAGELGLVAAENSQAVITAIGAGTQLKIQAGAGDATHVGGEIIVQSGVSDGQSSGALTVQTGADGGGGDSGPIDILTGAAATGTSGDITIRTGNGAEAGQILLKGGTGSDGNGGGITLEAGGSTTGGDNGWVAMQSVNVTHYVYVDSNGVVLDGKIGFYGITPIVKPTGVAVTAEGVHAALVSLGLISE